MSIRSKIIGTLQGVFGITKSGSTLAFTNTAGPFSFTSPDNAITDFVLGGSGARFRFCAGAGNSEIETRGDGNLRFSSDTSLLWHSGTTISGSADTAMSRAAAGVVRMHDGTTAYWLQNTAGNARRTATQAVTNSTTFAADDTLSITLKAGRRYRYYIWYAFTTVNTSGVKLDLNGGSATMTAINGTITIYSSVMALLVGVQITALTSTTGFTATGTTAFACIEGSLECNGAGTFIPRFAQNAETGAAENATAQVGSFITLDDVP